MPLATRADASVARGASHCNQNTDSSRPPPLDSAAIYGAKVGSAGHVMLLARRTGGELLRIGTSSFVAKPQILPCSRAPYG